MQNIPQIYTNYKSAFLSMDIEDWHDTAYLQSFEIDKSYSMLDGISQFIEILSEVNIKPTFFILSDLALAHKQLIRKLGAYDCEIACHGKTHQPPNLMTNELFRGQLIEAKSVLEELTGKPIYGYRAPSYSIDSVKYSIIEEVGFKYSSSTIDSNLNEFYGHVVLPESMREICEGIFSNGTFYEFKLPIISFLTKNVPVGGGGYLRIIPWFIYKYLVHEYINDNNNYLFYIHPYELSYKKVPKVRGLSFRNNIRLRRGLKTNQKKVTTLIHDLLINDFKFYTFNDWINQGNRINVE